MRPDREFYRSIVGKCRVLGNEFEFFNSLGAPIKETEARFILNNEWGMVYYVLCLEGVWYVKLFRSSGSIPRHPVTVYVVTEGKEAVYDPA